MTPAQKARLLGFNASLSQRGVSVKLAVNGLPYTVVIGEAPVDAPQFAIGQDSRALAIVAARRSDFGAQVVTQGDVFTDEDAGVSYRILRDDAHPSDVIARFRCEVAQVVA